MTFIGFGYSPAILFDHPLHEVTSIFVDKVVLAVSDTAIEQSTKPVVVDAKRDAIESVIAGHLGG